MQTLLRPARPARRRGRGAGGSGRRLLLTNVPLPEPVLVAIGLGVAWDVRHGTRCRTSRGPLVVGGALVTAGVAVVAGAWEAAGTDVLARPERVVVSGPYAWSRNPMYEGWMLLHAGLAALCGSRAVALGVPLAAVALHREVRHEEGRLAVALGQAYDAYLQAVPRYGLLGHLLRRAALAPERLRSRSSQGALGMSSHRTR